MERNISLKPIVSVVNCMKKFAEDLAMFVEGCPTVDEQTLTRLKTHLSNKYALRLTEDDILFKYITPSELQEFRGGIITLREVKLRKEKLDRLKAKRSRSNRPEKEVMTIKELMVESWNKAFQLTRAVLDVIVVKCGMKNLPHNFQILKFYLKYIFLAIKDCMEDVFKFQSACAYSKALGQVELPPRPECLPGEELDGIIIGGRVQRWISRGWRRAYKDQLNTDQRVTDFCYSLMNCKRACPAVSLKKQAAATKDHKANMRGAQYKGKSLDPNENEKLLQIAACVKILTDKCIGKWSPAEHLPPSASAHFDGTRVNGGAHNMLKEVVKQEYTKILDEKGNTIRTPVLVDIGCVATISEDGLPSMKILKGDYHPPTLVRQLVIDSLTYVDTGKYLEISIPHDGYEMNFRFADNYCKELSPERNDRINPIKAKVYLVLEPFKVRPITCGEAHYYHMGRLCQRSLHKKLKKKSYFRLIGERNSHELMRQFRGRSVIKVDGQIWFEFFESIDYKSATDGMHPYLTRCCADILKKNMECAGEISHAAFSKCIDATTGNHDLYYPCYDYDPKKPWLCEEHRGGCEKCTVKQTHGQLMGSPLSFIILNIVNAAILWSSYIDYIRDRPHLLRSNILDRLITEEKNLLKGFLALQPPRSKDFEKLDNFLNIQRLFLEKLDDVVDDRIAVERRIDELSQYYSQMGIDTQYSEYPDFEEVAYITQPLFNGDDGLFLSNSEFSPYFALTAKEAGMSLSVGKSYRHPLLAMINSEVWDTETWQRRFILNTGLLKGQGKVICDERDDRLIGNRLKRIDPICDQLRECLVGTEPNSEEQALVLELFYNHNKELLKETKRSWALPRQLGGLGLGEWARFRTEPTYGQRKLAGHLLANRESIAENRDNPSYVCRAQREEHSLMESLQLSKCTGLFTTPEKLNKYKDDLYRLRYDTKTLEIGPQKEGEQYPEEFYEENKNKRFQVLIKEPTSVSTTDYFFSQDDFLITKKLIEKEDREGKLREKLEAQREKRKKMEDVFGDMPEKRFRRVLKKCLKTNTPPIGSGTNFWKYKYLGPHTKHKMILCDEHKIAKEGLVRAKSEDRKLCEKLINHCTIQELVNKSTNPFCEKTKSLLLAFGFSKIELDLSFEVGKSAIEESLKMLINSLPNGGEDHNDYTQDILELESSEEWCDEFFYNDINQFRRVLSERISHIRLDRLIISEVSQDPIAQCS